MACVSRSNCWLPASPIFLHLQTQNPKVACTNKLRSAASSVAANACCALGKLAPPVEEQKSMS